MSKGEMAVIVTISWIAGLVVLALVFTISDAEPSWSWRLFLQYLMQNPLISPDGSF